MATVTAIYTGAALVKPLSVYFSQRFPEHTLINVLDDNLIAAVIKEGKMGDAVLRKIYAYCREAREAHSAVILETCSSVGESVDLIQPFLDIPILRIDAPMAEAAVLGYSRIGVIATLPTTLEPTIRLVEKTAEKKNRSVEVMNGLADGAFQALGEGREDIHDAKILQAAEKLKDKADVFLLAQGSMARMKEQLSERIGKPVLTSPESGMDSLASYLQGDV
ncbi:MAG: aspartate/glutamate racemase family protein [Spirochaetia bacterium]|nr:aspartate/glutamate racemase family protein [Spirochaetia bacterium]